MSGRITLLSRAFKASLQGKTPRDWAVLLCCQLLLVTGMQREARRQRLIGLCRTFIGPKDTPVACRSNGRICRFHVRRGNPYDMIIAAEFVQGLYPPHSVENIQNVTDCGANIGLFSIKAHSLYPNAKFICYEPSTDNLQILRKNLALNQIDADVRPVGCWEKDTTLYFREFVSNAGRFFDEPPGEAVPVEKPIVRENTWLKMDIEGAEFVTMPSVLEDQALPNVISMELHSPFGDLQALYSTLQSKGFPIDVESLPQEEYFNITLVRQQTDSTETQP